MRLINQYLGDLIKSLLSIDEKLKFLVSEYVALIFAYFLKGNTFQLVVIFSVIWCSLVLTPTGLWHHRLKSTTRLEKSSPNFGISRCIKSYNHFYQWI